MLASHFLADGDIHLPALTEADMSSWFHVKTLNLLRVDGLVEDVVILERNQSAKFVCVPYNGEFRFTRF
jgi:hypothetical protein